MLPERIGCFGFRKGGGFITGMQSGIALVDLEPTVKVKRVFDLEP